MLEGVRVERKPESRIELAHALEELFGRSLIVTSIRGTGLIVHALHRNTPSTSSLSATKIEMITSDIYSLDIRTEVRAVREDLTAALQHVGHDLPLTVFA